MKLEIRHATCSCIMCFDWFKVSWEMAADKWSKTYPGKPEPIPKLPTRCPDCEKEYDRLIAEAQFNPGGKAAEILEGYTRFPIK